MSPLTLFSVLFLLVFGGLGLVLIISSARQVSGSDEARKWPTVPGKIVTIDAKEHVYRHRRKHGGTRTRRLYEPQIEYEYTVEGVRYLGTRVGFGNYQMKLEAAKAFLQRFASGQVAVHYNPRDPNQAVLDITAKGATSGLVMGFIFLVIGIVITVVTVLAPRGH